MENPSSITSSQPGVDRALAFYLARSGRNYVPMRLVRQYSRPARYQVMQELLASEIQIKCNEEYSTDARKGASELQNSFVVHQEGVRATAGFSRNLPWNDCRFDMSWASTIKEAGVREHMLLILKLPVRPGTHPCSPSDTDFWCESLPV